MINLRQAAEMALEALQDTCDHLPARSGVEREVDDAITALRKALAEPEQRMSVEGSGKLTTKPYPDSYESEQEFRQTLLPVKTYAGGKPNYCTPEVTTEVPCKTHPDAPHGFNRSASFDEDRYVCDCEFWEPDVDNSAHEAEDVHGNVDNVNMSEERVHKSDKSIHEPAAMRYDFDGYGYKYIDSGSGSNWQTRIKDAEPLYAAPYTKLDTTAGVLHKEWVGLTGKEIAECIQMGEGGFVKLLATYRAIEAKLKEKNNG